MSNAEVAKHFASLPPDERASVLLINGDTAGCQTMLIDPPGTNLEDIDDDEITAKQRQLITTYLKW